MMKSTREFDDAWQPAWFGSLGSYAAAVEDHSMSAVKRSIARLRTLTAVPERQPPHIDLCAAERQESSPGT